MVISFVIRISFDEPCLRVVFIQNNSLRLRAVLFNVRKFITKKKRKLNQSYPTNINVNNILALIDLCEYKKNDNSEYNDN